MDTYQMDAAAHTAVTDALDALAEAQLAVIEVNSNKHRGGRAQTGGRPELDNAVRREMKGVVEIIRRHRLDIICLENLIMVANTRKSVSLQNACKLCMLNVSSPVAISRVRAINALVMPGEARPRGRPRTSPTKPRSKAEIQEQTRKALGVPLPRKDRRPEARSHHVPVTDNMILAECGKG